MFKDDRSTSICQAFTGSAKRSPNIVILENRNDKCHFIYVTFIIVFRNCKMYDEIGCDQML